MLLLEKFWLYSDSIFIVLLIIDKFNWSRSNTYVFFIRC